MNVKLVHVTPNAEELIVKMARVSAPHNQSNMDTAPKLIKYLLTNQHWSPFEMANMCVEIQTTRAISPQILRHRSFSFQEFSQRYANALEQQTTLELPELRRQDTKNRQNSIDDLSQEFIEEYCQRIFQLYEDAKLLYSDMIKNGVAKECARNILPMSTCTTLYMNGTLRSWIHYIKLREANGTQKEHQDIAIKIKSIFTNEFPVIASACFD